jgi:hypothetical protein
MVENCLFLYSERGGTKMSIILKIIGKCLLQYSVKRENMPRFNENWFFYASIHDFLPYKNSNNYLLIVITNSRTGHDGQN